MTTLVCFLEEPSAKEMLKGILPRLLQPGIHCVYIVFDGKQDMDKQLIRKLRGWQKPDTAFLVLRDQDSTDCIVVKNRLTDMCREAITTDVLVRIACRELESFYFGDLSAVEKGLGIENIATQKRKAKYRIPDSIEKPSKELEKLTKGSYQKVSGSRSISQYLSLENNTSHSFRVLLAGIQRL